MNLGFKIPNCTVLVFKYRWDRWHKTKHRWSTLYFYFNFVFCNAHLLTFILSRWQYSLDIKNNKWTVSRGITDQWCFTYVKVLFFEWTLVLLNKLHYLEISLSQWFYWLTDSPQRNYFEPLHMLSSLFIYESKHYKTDRKDIVIPVCQHFSGFSLRCIPLDV